MTVASFIEAGAIPPPGLGKTLGAVRGVERAGAASLELLSSTVSAAVSFRANWQTLLASLNSSIENFSGTEVDQGTAIIGPASEQTSGRYDASTLTAHGSLRQGQGREKGSVEKGAGTMLPPAGVRTQALANEPVAVATKQASTISEEKNYAAAQETESAHSSRPVRSVSAIKSETVPTEPLPGLIPAAMASLSQAVPAAAIVGPVAQCIDEKAQPSQTEISANLTTEQPAAIASASFDPHPLARNASGKTAETVNPAEQQTAEGVVTSAQPGQSTHGSSLSSSFGPSLSETEAATAHKDAPSSAVLLAENSNPPGATAQTSSLTPSAQTAVQNANPAEEIALNQPLARTFKQDDPPIQPLSPSTNLTATLATSHASLPALAPEQSRTPVFVPSQNLSQIVAPSQSPSEAIAPSQASSATPSPHPIPAQPASQNLTQTTAPNTSPTETPAENQLPSQTLVSSQYQAPMFIQSQEPIAIQPIIQGVNVSAAPMPGDGLTPLPATASVAAAQSGLLSALPTVLGKQISTTAQRPRRQIQ